MCQATDTPLQDKRQLSPGIMTQAGDVVVKSNSELNYGNGGLFSHKCGGIIDSVLGVVVVIRTLS